MIKILLDVVIVYVVCAFISGFVIAYGIYEFCGQGGIKNIPTQLQWVLILTGMLLWPKFVVRHVKRKIKNRNLSEDEIYNSCVNDINDCIDCFEKEMEEDP